MGYLDDVGLAHLWKKIKGRFGMSADGSGTSVGVDSGSRLKSLTVHGESVQDGTPTPTAPIPIRSVGPINHIINGDGLVVSGLGSASGSRAEYKYANLGQSYMDIAHGTKVTISFDLYMTVNTANPTLQVYNTNNRGPKQFASGTNTDNGVSLTFTASVGQVINRRVSATGYIRDRANASVSYNAIEFYSGYGSSNWFSVSNLQLEVGDAPHPFMPYDIIGVLVTGNNILDVSHHMVSTAFADGQAGKKTVDSTGLVSSVSTTSDGRGWNYPYSDAFVYLSAGTYTLEWFVSNPSTSGSCGCKVFGPDGTAIVDLAGSSVFDRDRSATFTLSNDQYVGLFFKMYGATARFMLVRGSEALNEYELYGGSVTAIPLNGHELRSLPDGTRDELTVDTDGHVTMTQRVGYANVPTTDGSWSINSNNLQHPIGGIRHWLGWVYSKLCNAFSGDALSSNASYLVIRNHGYSTVDQFVAAMDGTQLVLVYPLAEPQTIDLGTIDMPQVKDGDTVEVIAALTPSIDAAWWTAQAGAFKTVNGESIVGSGDISIASADEVETIYETSAWTIKRVGHVVMVQAHGIQVTPSPSTPVLDGILADYKPSYNVSATISSADGSVTQVARLAVYASSGSVYIVTAGTSANVAWYGTLTYIY